MAKFNRVDNVHCAPWLVIPTVYQDALSYEEQLNKFCYSLNQIIGNVNQLPDYIKDLISEYIKSGEINDTIRETLSRYILNVKYPPEGIKGAVGDGTADDTEAIQGCIDYANKNGGMAVYFPSGKYLTDSLTVKNNVSLFGFDRYTTKVVLKGGATKALINSIDGNFSVSGMTLDGNAGNQVNDVNVLNLICRDVLLADLILEDGFKLLMWNGTGGYLQIDNVVCGNAVNKCFEISGNSKVTMNAVEFTYISSVGGDYVIEVDSNHGYYEFSSVAVCDTCLMCTGNDNTFRFREEFAQHPFIDNGERNNFDVLGVTDYNKLTGSRSVSIGGNDTLNVNGESNTRVSGGRTMHVEGANTFNAGDLTENIVNEKHVIAGSVTEDITGDKHVNAANEIHNANIFDIENTLKYKNPIPVNDFYSNVPVMSRSGGIYNLMCATGKTENITKYLGNYPGVVTIGDSYGQGEGGGTIGKYTPWTTLVKNYLGLTENVNYWTNSLGGAGFKVALQGKNFEQLLNELSETMSEQNRNTVGKILVAGGYNDTENIYPENLTDFFNTAKLKFPNAIVYVACIGWGTNRGIATNIFNNTVPSYSKGASLNGGVYIINSEYSLHNYTWFDSDGIHPNNDGQKNIAQMMVSGLLSGSCNNDYYITPISVTANTSVCNECNITGYCSLRNGVINLFFDFGKTIIFEHTLNANAPLLLGTLNCDLINALENPAYCSIPIVAYTSYESGKYFNPVANCWIQGKNLYLNIININAEENGFKELGTLGTMEVRFLNTSLMTGYC